MCSVGIFSACTPTGRDKYSEPVSSEIDSDKSRPNDENNVDEIFVDETPYEFVLSNIEETNKKCTYTFVDKNDSGITESFTLKCENGTKGAYSFNEESNTLTFSGFEDDSDGSETEYSLEGSFHGNIIIDSTLNEVEQKFTLDLEGFSLTSYYDCPIYISAGDKISISAKNGTQNFIYDLRDMISEDEDEILDDVAESQKSASIYSACDLDVKGKGELYIKSTDNNGIHTKDDLDLKNLTLYVDCADNCLKGNDSLTIESGSYTLISRRGDALKTTNSDISKKGNQRGTIEIDSGNILIYSACDSIDASYDVIVGEENSDDFPEIEIYTDKYSKYSEVVTNTDDSYYYIQCKYTIYTYSIKYFNDDKNYVWKNSSDCITKVTNNQTYYYYPIEKVSGYSNMQVFVYESGQKQGQENDYFKSVSMTPSNSYDTIHFSVSKGYTFSWTNYTTTKQDTMTSRPGQVGGIMGNDSNTDKGDYSTKGIKADNKVVIYDGNIFISSYDDAIHANSDNSLENEESPEGSVFIYGGNLELYSNDDAIHADETLKITGGEISVGGSYEGLEGKFVNISGGNISVTSSDDGINGTSDSGAAINISGGQLYIYAGGDGLDSNSRESYRGIIISGGRSIVISVGNADSSIDNENGYKYTGGYILGVSVSGGTSSESSKCNEFKQNGTSMTIKSLSAGSYIYVNEYVSVRIPVTMSAYVVFLCERSNVSISTQNESNLEYDSNGVCWLV